jgi:hypothetical protein
MLIVIIHREKIGNYRCFFIFNRLSLKTPSTETFVFCRWMNVHPVERACKDLM